MNQIVIKCGDHLVSSWVSNMTRLLPEFQILPYNLFENIKQEKVRYIIGWCPDATWVNTFPNLKALVSIGSGVDHIINLEQLRDNIPVIRTVSPDLVQRMKEYITMCVLAWHRRLLPILEANKNRKWDRFAVPTASEVTVGIMGFGGMGRAAAEILSSIGYKIRIWANSKRENVGYQYYFGDDSLIDFVSACDILICLLPLTTRTKEILNYNLFKSMKKGACLINAARGKHLNEKDLRRAMEEQLLSHAFLDGLFPEPLPADASIWNIQNTTITFHSAAYISPEVGPQIIANNIRAYEKGDFNGPLYDSSLGY